MFDFLLKKIGNYVWIDFSHKIKWVNKRVVIGYNITSNELIDYDLIKFYFVNP